jgi:hypothetical protein
MDVFDALYLGTPANQALDAPPFPEQMNSRSDGSALKLGKPQEMSAYYGPLKDDERLEAEFLEECRSLEAKAPS